MSTEREKILTMVSEGKLTVDEAGRLLDALSSPKAKEDSDLEPPVFEKKKNLKFLRVTVDSKQGDNVNVQVPVALLRAGLKLSALIPPHAYQKLNESISEKGLDFDLNQLLKSGNIEEIIESMEELNVDINSADGDKVKVFFE
ncbi:MAG: hypothetical protein GX640_23845 [Fibrobacter sp.]|nr:hypothetical protein [Fibrobacter sp.]